MLTEENLVLTRSEPNGNGGLQFVYRINNYGVAAVNFPTQDITQLEWTVDVIKFRTADGLQYDLCHTTDLAKKTLTFRNDRAVNEFLEKAFVYLKKPNFTEGVVE
ncbi:hypothetical protein [Nitrospina watsonii]|uniref:Uncharacterized protein n=1 Tax=Nitrospina watsonii TaxID=1323948 RepID=A0ABM9HD63_9BACT|nr:hypothetical protein [Nitrospina watsonii]CAI2718034.1 conserved protein of unknown function [Nitrospina watsonii]